MEMGERYSIKPAHAAELYTAKQNWNMVLRLQSLQNFFLTPHSPKNTPRAEL